MSKKKNKNIKEIISKKTIILIIVSIILICLVSIILFKILKPKKSYNVEAIRTEMVRYYDNMRIMDFIDLTELFGLNLSTTENAVFLSNIEFETGVTLDTVMIIVINTKDTVFYYDIFDSFVQSYKFNTDDIDMLNYYDKVKLVQGDGYIYFLMGEDTVMLEKEINSFYN